ncbi:MAG TPA: alpha/beta fold hydrolase, partial [Solirubrobacteraceae bacterium]|nr:alpha/beta fold hydrolase [Solirubrobacteraceae bacterium]
MIAPVTRYTTSRGASIAYQVVGDGPLDLVFMTGWVSQVEQLWEADGLRRMLERLAVFGRLILFDRRGTGLSDGGGEPFTLEQEAEDALVVLDAVGSERAALFTYGLGGPVAVQLAVEHPERVGALIMYASIARALWAPDYDWAMTREERAGWVEQAVASWGAIDHPGIPVMAPSMAADPTLTGWFARLQRLAASPGNARQLLIGAGELDVRELLKQVSVPTLVMHRAGDTAWDPRHSRYIAEHVPGARYVELEGIDSLPFLGDSDAIVEEIEEFLTGGRAG